MIDGFKKKLISLENEIKGHFSKQNSEPQLINCVCKLEVILKNFYNFALKNKALEEFLSYSNKMAFLILFLVNHSNVYLNQALITRSLTIVKALFCKFKILLSLQIKNKIINNNEIKISFSIDLNSAESPISQESFSIFLQNHNINFKSKIKNQGQRASSQTFNLKLNNSNLTSLITCLSHLKKFVLKHNGRIPRLSFSDPFNENPNLSRSYSASLNPQIDMISSRIRNFDPNSLSCITLPKPEDGYVPHDDVQIWGKNVLELATPGLMFDMAWGQGNTQLCLALISKFKDVNLMKKMIVLLGHQFFALKKILTQEMGVSNLKILEAQAQINKINLILKKMVLVFDNQQANEILASGFVTLLQFLQSDESLIFLKFDDLFFYNDLLEKYPLNLLKILMDHKLTQEVSQILVSAIMNWKINLGKKDYSGYSTDLAIIQDLMTVVPQIDRHKIIKTLQTI